MFAHWVCTFLLLWVSCQAYVDLYKWKNQEVLDSLHSVSDEAFSFSAKKVELLVMYSGTAAETCKEKLSKETGYGPNFAILQTKMYSVNSLVKQIDTRWYTATQACEGDHICEEAAAQEGRKELHNLKMQQLADINAINQRYLDAVKNYMGRCLGRQNFQ